MHRKRANLFRVHCRAKVIFQDGRQLWQTLEIDSSRLQHLALPPVTTATWGELLPRDGKGTGFKRAKCRMNIRLKHLKIPVSAFLAIFLANYKANYLFLPLNNTKFVASKKKL